MKAAACLAVALGVVLAGCSDPPGSAGPDAPGTSGTSTDGPVVPVAAETVVRHLDWNGSLPNGVWACDAAVTHECRAQPTEAYGVSHVFEGVLGNVTAGELTLSWTATSELTSELTIDAAILTPGCDDCNVTQLPSATGASPLRVPLAGSVLAQGEQIGVSVYSALYAVLDDVVVGTSGEQDFRVQGDLTMQD